MSDSKSPTGAASAASSSSGGASPSAASPSASAASAASSSASASASAAASSSAVSPSASGAASSPAAAAATSAANSKAGSSAAAAASPGSGSGSVTMAWGGGRYTGAVSASGQPHGFGTLERGADKGEGGPGVSYRGVWSNGVLSVGVRSCPRERLHYEGQFERLERQGMGIEWRVVETPVPAAQQAAATAAGAAAAPAPPAASRIVGEVHRAGRWSRDERVAECPVPRKLLTEARFISEADKNSGLEFVMSDGTACAYEGERNALGEPHGRGRMLNMRGEAVAGDMWLDGAQEGEGFYHLSDGEQYTGGLVRGFKSGQGRHSFPDGEVYEGGWLANLKHGLGCQTWDDGYEFEGEWRADEQTGFGIEYTRAGKISACGRWLHSEMKEWHAVPRSVLPKGKFLSEKAKNSDLLYSDGGYYKGAVNEKSEAHGKGILYTATHQIVQGGRFQHGKLDGEGFTNHPDGGRYAGEHKGGLREGVGKLQLANGDKYSGNFHNNLQHGRGVYTWSKGDVYDGSWCLEYGTEIVTCDPSRRTMRVEDLAASDVGSLSLVGQDAAPVPLQKLDRGVTAREKFVLSDVEGRSHAVTAQHRVPLVWALDPSFAHHEAAGQGAFPAWSLTAWSRGGAAAAGKEGARVGERVTIHLRYWPSDITMPEGHDDEGEASAVGVESRPLFRGSKAQARGELAALAREVSLRRGDVVELQAVELWARMDAEFRASAGDDNGKEGVDRVGLAVASDSESVVPPEVGSGALSNEAGIRSAAIKSVVKHVITIGDEAVEAEAGGQWDKAPGAVVVERPSPGQPAHYRFVNIAVGGNHRFRLSNGTITHNSDVRMHGVGKYSWPDGIVYIGEWVAGVQSGLGFKWSGLGTKAQFGRWLDNKFVQTLYVAPAILAKMPGWTVEEFQHELDTRWADYQRPAQQQQAAAAAAAGTAAAGAAGTSAGGAAGAGGKGKKGGGGAGKDAHGSSGGANGANGSSASSTSGSSAVSTGTVTACICTCAYKCGCRCVCSCAHCAAASVSDEWPAEVFDLIRKMRQAKELEPHMLTAARLHREEDRVN